MKNLETTDKKKITTDKKKITNDKYFGELRENKKELYKHYIYPTITLLTLFALWQVIVVKIKVPGYVLPSPVDIIEKLIEDRDLLFMHSKVTLIEAGLGLIISLIFAMFSGFIMDFFPIVRKCFYPLLYMTQMIPTITIAPLLLIWFGFGIHSKVLCVILTCFFPILVTFMDGMENIDNDYLNLFRIMKSSKLKTFIHLKFPMSMDKFLSGIKMSSTYAFIAATVSEWLGGTAGLGVYMVRAKSAYALDKVFASTLLIIVFSLFFVGLFTVIKKIIIK
ncbi:ABC transporter permease [Peptostreptococcus equinus]|uniref:ABC transporter permease n=1 Tax=Peptostreptococcus equinus TaxID=3003601 RepID=A0ABY7JUX9_9FIRM|nr:ABC transporter permease [Peptostreptococcus sp. CBA3647]WAW15795.1 ABC transporter permease [Peptostreptococcus sp. CBA3647]